MVTVKIIAGLCVSLALFACAPAEMPSRGLMDISPAVGSDQPASEIMARLGGKQLVAAHYNIVDFTVVVPQSLLVSNADVYLPNADIVWHGDPPGDRRAQVKALFVAGFTRGTANMTQGQAIMVNIEVQRFHALSPRARATVGGNFAMQFILTVYDAATGAILDGPRMVRADTPASGGVRALREESQGMTQTTVIEARLEQEFRIELAQRYVIIDGAVPVSRNDFSPSDLTLAE